MRALYISPHLSAKEFGGSKFAATNLDLLRTAFPGPVVAAAVSRTPSAAALAVPTTKDKLGTALANLQGLAGTLSRPGVEYLSELLDRERPTLVWLDSSILGSLIPLTRHRIPEAKIVCAFQNVEADLIRQRLASKQLHYLPALYATWINERRSAGESDLTLALHATDAERIGELYGRPVDGILPITLPDGQTLADGNNFEPRLQEPYVLYVGSATPPNIEALDFIHRQIAPQLQRFRLVVVGNGLDVLASRFAHPKLEVLGFVKDLHSVYSLASAVIAPIFSGGGMKVKIAEALMHGKTVIATPFAAIGYERCRADSVRLAHDGAEFVALIEALGENCTNVGSRADYDDLFSRAVGLAQVEAIVERLLRT